MENIRKILSRVIDYACFWSILVFTLDFFDLDLLYYLLLTLSLPLLFIPIETLCIRLFKTTLGRYICGLKYNELFTWKSAFRLAYKKGVFRSSPARVVRSEPKLLGRILAIFLTLFVLFPDTVINQTSRVLPFEFLQTLRIERNGGVDIPPNWIKFNHNDLPFYVFLPKEPKLTETKQSIPHSNHVLVYREYTEEGYSVAYIELPSSWTKWGSGIVFKGALNKVISHEKGTIIEKHKALHDGLPALEYQLSHNGKITHGKLILSGNTIYKLEATDHDDTAKTFFNTFHLQST